MAMRKCRGPWPAAPAPSAHTPPIVHGDSLLGIQTDQPLKIGQRLFPTAFLVMGLRPNPHRVQVSFLCPVTPSAREKGRGGGGETDDSTL